MTQRACGSWPSPLSAATLAAGRLSLGDVVVDGDAVVWTETRPAEAARAAVMRWDGTATELAPEAGSIRTRVHEYGGGSLAAGDGMIIGATADGSLWRLDGVPHRITAASDRRYADMVIDARRGRVIAVAEDHIDGQPVVNRLVAVELADGTATTLVEGADFYASPRLSADLDQLCWISWDHPRMPWDGTELWRARLDDDGLPTAAERVAGSSSESVLQPRFESDGSLLFVSDRSGYWNLQRARGSETTAVLPMAADCASPAWVFGMSQHATLADGRLAVAACHDGVWQLWLADADGSQPRRIAEQLTDIEWLTAHPAGLLLEAGSATEPTCLRLVDVDGGGEQVLFRPHDELLPADSIAAAEPIQFDTFDGGTGHAFLYRPRLAGSEPLAGERPPLVVRVHGGPTAQAGTALDLGVQFWTSRGLAVLDVNYGGSSGHGRAYRERLRGQLGCIDVDDCVAAADHVARIGLADPDRLVIRGGSHGGYVVLASMVFHPTAYAGGVSLFGFGDLLALARDTHKFESHYLDSLVGVLPGAESLYHNRSPIHLATRIARPLLLLQGADDHVVPPAQATAMAERLTETGTPHACVIYEGEGHGFRRADTQIAAYEAELGFYEQVLGFEAADEITPPALEPPLRS